MKYRIKKHPYLPVAIIRFPSKTVIMPEILECDPDTTLDDIEIINEEDEQKHPKTESRPI
jgi:hypothetical protein